MPTVHDDIQFLKNEFRKLRKWLGDYFDDKSKDSDFDRKVALLEFGPFGLIRIILAIILAFIGYYIFSVSRAPGAPWILLVFFIIALDFIFAKEFITPVIKGIFGVVFEFISDMLGVIKDILMFWK